MLLRVKTDISSMYGRLEDLNNNDGCKLVVVFVDRGFSSDYVYVGANPITMAENTVMPLVISESISFSRGEKIKLPQDTACDCNYWCGFDQCF